MKVQLGDVLSSIIGGGTPSKDREDYFQGDIPLMTVKDMRSRRPSGTGFNITAEALANSSAKLVPADTLVIATRMGLGKIVRAPFETAINQDLKALFPAEGMDKSFVEFWFLSMAQRIEAMGTGTTVKGIRLNGLAGLDFPLPLSEEQRRIVEKIEVLFVQLDKGEEAVRQVQGLLKRYRQSVLKAAVTGALTADWRAENRDKLDHGRDLLARILDTRRETWAGRSRYKEPVTPDTSDLPELPEGWVWAAVDAVGEVTTGATPASAKKDAFFGGDIPFLKPTDLDQGALVAEAREFLTDAGADASRTVRKGAVLVTCIGATTGKTGVNRFDRAAFNQQINAVEPFDTVALGDYLYWVFVGSAFQAQIWANAAATTLPIINKSKFSRLPVPVPSVAEQSVIVAVVEAQLARADELERLCETELARASALRQSILKQAFAGRLVPQDPADEPASALLARIRAAAPGKKTRKAKA
ncbi:restriction endonuclease subunit S [Sinisalibacter lacisalsi]|nr:restriction endonuclease subunit S [Sinisalibacter lacisalsi]